MVTPVDIKITPPTRQNTSSAISLSTKQQSQLVKDNQGTNKELSEMNGKVTEIDDKATALSISDCEVTDKDAYGDVGEHDVLTSTESNTANLPNRLLEQEDSVQNNDKMREEPSEDKAATITDNPLDETQNDNLNIIESQSNQDINNKVLDTGGLKSKTNEKGDGNNSKDEQRSTDDGYTHSRSSSVPSILVNNNANSAFEHATFYV